MPDYTIETTYHLPAYRHRTYSAATVAEACRLAIEDGDLGRGRAGIDGEDGVRDGPLGSSSACWRAAFGRGQGLWACRVRHHRRAMLWTPGRAPRWWCGVRALTSVSAGRPAPTLVRRIGP